MPWKTLWNSWLELVNHALPLDFGALEVDEQADGEAGGTEIIETLGGVVRGEVIDTFQFKYAAIFNKDVGEIVANVVPLVGYLEGGLTGSFDAAKAELSEQRPLVYFLQKAGSESIRDLEDCAEHPLRYRVDLICVHLRLSAAKKKCGFVAKLSKRFLSRR
jgi:hypothetical protein